MLLGRNGANKTTTLRTIMGLWRASAGAVEFDGAPIHRHARPDIAQLGIAYVPEHGHLRRPRGAREPAAGRARESLADIDTQRLEWIFGLFPALKKFWLYPAGKLSGGQKQMLAIARAIVEPAKLLLIDRPSKGLAPRHRRQPDRRLARAEGDADHGAAGGAELRHGQSAGRHGGGDGRRPRGPRRWR